MDHSVYAYIIQFISERTKPNIRLRENIRAFFHRRSTAERAGYFDCLFVNMITSKRLNIG